MNIDRIQILGPFNSGTNLIAKILRRNLNKRVQLHHEGSTLCWKHTMGKKEIIRKINRNPIETSGVFLFLLHVRVIIGAVHSL